MGRTSFQQSFADARNLLGHICRTKAEHRTRVDDAIATIHVYGMFKGYLIGMVIGSLWTAIVFTYWRLP